MLCRLMTGGYLSRIEPEQYGTMLLPGRELVPLVEGEVRDYTTLPHVLVLGLAAGCLSANGVCVLVDANAGFTLP